LILDYNASPLRKFLCSQLGITSSVNRLLNKQAKRYSFALQAKAARIGIS